MDDDDDDDDDDDGDDYDDDDDDDDDGDDDDDDDDGDDDDDVDDDDGWWWLMMADDDDYDDGLSWMFFFPFHLAKVGYLSSSYSNKNLSRWTPTDAENLLTFLGDHPKWYKQWSDKCLNGDL